MTKFRHTFATAKQYKANIEKMAQSLIKKWGNLGKREQDKVAFELAGLCNVAIETVKTWAKGQRTPKPANQEIIEKYLSEKEEKGI